jgi:hypothetical protein
MYFSLRISRKVNFTFGFLILFSRNNVCCDLLEKDDLSCSYREKMISFTIRKMVFCNSLGRWVHAILRKDGFFTISLRKMGSFAILRK